MTMKERLAALEKIALEKKKREQEAVAEAKANKAKVNAPSKNAQAAAGKKTAYVPPPPKDGVQLPVPHGDAVRTFPISTGDSPWMLSIPGV